MCIDLSMYLSNYPSPDCILGFLALRVSPDFASVSSTLCPCSTDSLEESAPLEVWGCRVFWVFHLWVLGFGL